MKKIFHTEILLKKLFGFITSWESEKLTGNMELNN